MERAIMWILACGALLGGLDRILGNRLHLGEKFEQGFLLLGPTALSMAGILCLVPLLARLLSACVAPLFAPLGIDPAVFAGFLAVDMGGYPLAVGAAADPAVGRFAGVVLASTLGCTVSFTIPVGMSALRTEDRPAFSRGALFGLAGLPAALVVGGLICGLTFKQLIVQSLPVLLLAALVILGLWKWTAGMIRGFSIFARCIQILSTAGLMLGAFEFMTGRALLPGLAPLEDGMAVVASIGVAMLGSLPAAELLQRALRRPLQWLSGRTGMNSASIAALLAGAVSVLPAIAMMRDMDARGKVVNAAFMVCAASALAAHLGFVAGVDAGMVPALLASKFAGGAAGALIALFATRSRPR